MRIDLLIAIIFAEISDRIYEMSLEVWGGSIDFSEMLFQHSIFFCANLNANNFWIACYT